MYRTFQTILILLLCAKSYCQSFVFDTTRNTTLTRKSSYYYSKTEFTLIDTLDYWNYLLDTFEKDKFRGSESIGTLKFWRTKPTNFLICGQNFWSPDISFSIYSIKDSFYCYQVARITREVSSCGPPNVGGDIIVVGNFVFISDGVCLQCLRNDTGVDYCRPLINYLFLNIDKNKISTIEALVEQFQIKKGNWETDIYRFQKKY